MSHILPLCYNHYLLQFYCSKFIVQLVGVWNFVRIFSPAPSSLSSSNLSISARLPYGPNFIVQLVGVWNFVRIVSPAPSFLSSSNLSISARLPYGPNFIVQLVGVWNFVRIVSPAPSFLSSSNLSISARLPYKSLWYLVLELIIMHFLCLFFFTMRAQAHCQQCNDTHTNDYLLFCPGTWRRSFSACNTF